ncbi:MAG: membrane protein insertion efficiency factor YidD [Gammaproteobacteria bacterium]|nr:membrane protein insertion efficiency factor YidD [Gammaproteobacteria bacterium]
MPEAAGEARKTSVAATALIAMIRAYQLALSPFLGRQCRFLPTCSAYAAEAVRRHGACRGGWLGILRILRCQPLCRAGHDPVPEVFSWRGSRPAG